MSVRDEARTLIEQSPIIPVGEKDYAMQVLDDLVKATHPLKAAGISFDSLVHVCTLPGHHLVSVPFPMVEDMLAEMLAEMQIGELGGRTLSKLREFDAKKLLRVLFITPAGMTVVLVQPKEVEPSRRVDVNCTAKGSA